MATTSAQADLDVFVRAILKLKKTGKEKKQIEALVGQIFSQVKDTTKNLNIKINPNLNFDLKGINQQIAAQKAKVDAAISQTFQERKGGPFAGKKKSELQGLSSTLGGFNQILDPVVQKGKGLTFSDSVTKTLDAMAAGTTRFSQLSSAQQSVVKDHVGFMQEQAKGLAVANKFLEKQGITLFSDKAAKSEFRRFQKDTRELTRQVNAGEIAGANNAAQRSEALFARSSQIVKRLGGDLAKDQAGAFSKLSLDDALSVDRGIAARLGLVKREVDALADAGVNAGASFKSAEKELNLLTKQRDTLKQVRSAKTLPVGQTIKAQEKLELAREDQLKKQLKLASELGKFDPSTATNKQAQALKALQVEAGDALTAVSKLSKGNQAFRKDVKAAADEQLLQNRAVRDNISLVRAREITSGKPSQKRDDLSVSEATQRQKALDRVSQAERSVKEARSPSRIKGAEAVPLTKNELTNLKSATNELGAANKALQGTYRGASQEAIEGQRKTTAAINQTKASVKALDGDLTASTQRQKQAAQLRQGRGVIKNIGGVENVGQEFGGLSVSDQKAVAATLAQKKTTLGKQEGRLISAGATNENSKFNASLVRTQSELAKAQQAIDSITKSTEKYQTTTQQAGQVLRQFLKFAIGYAVLFKAIGAIQALVSGLIQLDKRLVSISAIAQTTPAELDEIATAIQRVATTTQFSTSEIAEAAQVLSQAGVNPSEIAQSLSSVADLAAATNSALSVSADLVSTIRNVFTELDDRTIADQLTKAVNISKLTTNDLQTILSRSGQVSKAFNISSAQLLASATVLRNAGIKASTVSTGLRQGILEVLSPDAKTIKVLKGRYKALGEELSEADIKSKFFGFASDPTPLISALKELRRLGAGGSGALDFRRVFDIRAENVINALIKNLGDVEKNLTSLSSGGSAARGAERQLDSLANSFDNMNAAITAFTANLTGGMLPALAQVFQFLTKVITQLDSLQTKFVSEKGVGIESFGILSGLAGIAVGGRARRGALARADPKASPSQKLLNSGAATVVGLGAGLGTVAGITAGGVAGVALADAVGADEEITAAITLGTSAAGGAIAANIGSLYKKATAALIAKNLISATAVLPGPLKLIGLTAGLGLAIAGIVESLFKSATERVSASRKQLSNAKAIKEELDAGIKQFDPETVGSPAADLQRGQVKVKEANEALDRLLPERLEAVGEEGIAFVERLDEQLDFIGANTLDEGSEQFKIQRKKLEKTLDRTLSLDDFKEIVTAANERLVGEEKALRLIEEFRNRAQAVKIDGSNADKILLRVITDLRAAGDTSNAFFSTVGKSSEQVAEDFKEIGRLFAIEAKRQSDLINIDAARQVLAANLVDEARDISDPDELTKATINVSDSIADFENTSVERVEAINKALQEEAERLQKGAVSSLFTPILKLVDFNKLFNNITAFSEAFNEGLERRIENIKKADAILTQQITEQEQLFATLQRDAPEILAKAFERKGVPLETVENPTQVNPTTGALELTEAQKLFSPAVLKANEDLATVVQGLVNSIDDEVKVRVGAQLQITALDAEIADLKRDGEIRNEKKIIEALELRAKIEQEVLKARVEALKNISDNKFFNELNPTEQEKFERLAEKQIIKLFSAEDKEDKDLTAVERTAALGRNTLDKATADSRITDLNAAKQQLIAARDVEGSLRVTEAIEEVERQLLKNLEERVGLTLDGRHAAQVDLDTQRNLNAIRQKQRREADATLAVDLRITDLKQKEQELEFVRTDLLLSQTETSREVLAINGVLKGIGERLVLLQAERADISDGISKAEEKILDAAVRQAKEKPKERNRQQLADVLKVSTNAADIALLRLSNEVQALADIPGQVQLNGFLANIESLGNNRFASNFDDLTSAAVVAKTALLQQSEATLKLALAQKDAADITVQQQRIDEKTLRDIAIQQQIETQVVTSLQDQADKAFADPRTPRRAFREAQGLGTTTETKLEDLAATSASLNDTLIKVDKAFNAGTIDRETRDRLIQEFNIDLAETNGLMSKLNAGFGEQILLGLDLDGLKASIQDLDSSMQNLGDNIRERLITAFDELGDAIADSLLEGKPLGESLDTIGDDLLKGLARDNIKTLLNNVAQNAITGVQAIGSAIGGEDSGLDDLFGGVGKQVAGLLGIDTSTAIDTEAGREDRVEALGEAKDATQVGKINGVTLADLLVVNVDQLTALNKILEGLTGETPTAEAGSPLTQLGESGFFSSLLGSGVGGLAGAAVSGIGSLFSGDNGEAVASGTTSLVDAISGAFDTGSTEVGGGSDRLGLISPESNDFLSQDSFGFESDRSSGFDSGGDFSTGAGSTTNAIVGGIGSVLSTGLGALGTILGGGSGEDPTQALQRDRSQDLQNATNTLSLLKVIGTILTVDLVRGSQAQILKALSNISQTSANASGNSDTITGLTGIGTGLLDSFASDDGQISEVNASIDETTKATKEVGDSIDIGLDAAEAASDIASASGGGGPTGASIAGSAIKGIAQLASGILTFLAIDKAAKKQGIELQKKQNEEFKEFTDTVNNVNNQDDIKRLASVRRLAEGGIISGPGTSTSDSIPAVHVDNGQVKGMLALSTNEAILNAKATRLVGSDFIHKLNSGALKTTGFAVGGIVGSQSLPSVVNLSRAGLSDSGVFKALVSAGAQQQQRFEEFQTRAFSLFNDSPTAVDVQVGRGTLDLTLREWLEGELANISAGG